MKIIITFILISFLTLSLFAQINNEDDYYDPNFNTGLDSASFYPENNIDKKLTTNITAGSMFFNSSYGNAFSSYIAPSLDYSISKKIKIRTGLMLANTNLFSSGNGEMSSYSDRYNNVMLFAQGEYQLSNKILLRSTIIKDLNNSFSNSSFESYSFGFDYKVSEKTSFGIDIQFSKNNYPFYHHTGFGNTYGRNNFFNY